MATFTVINGMKRLVSTCDAPSLYDYASSPEYITVPRRFLEREIRRVIEESLTSGGRISELACDCMCAIDADVEAHDREMTAKALELQTSALQMDADVAKLQEHSESIPAMKKPLLDRLIREFVVERQEYEQHMQKYIDPLREELEALNQHMEAQADPAV